VKYLNSLLKSSIAKKILAEAFKRKPLTVPVQPIDDRDWMMPDLNVKGTIALENFSQRSRTLPVKNQGRIGSCVGQSGRVVYGFCKEFDGSEPSVMHIYKTGQKFDPWPGESYSGTTIRGAALGLKEHGCCEEIYWPYTGKENAPMKNGAKENAASKKIEGFYVIDKNDSNLIKSTLLKEPLWTSIMVHEDLYYTNSSGVIDDEKYLKSKKSGGHAIAMIGWKTIKGNLYWEFQNSWGKWFGDDGYFYLSDNLYKKIIINANGPFYIKAHSENKKIPPAPIEKENFTTFIIKFFKNLIDLIINMLKKREK